MEEKEEITKNIDEELCPAGETTLTKEIKTAIEIKEKELEGFDEIKADPLEQDEIVETKKFKHFGTIGAILLVGIGVFIVLKDLKPKENNDDTVVEG